MTVNEIRVILKLSEILTDPEEMRKWLHLNLRQFDGRTALQLIRGGRVRDVLSYLQAAVDKMNFEKAQELAKENGVILDEKIPDAALKLVETEDNGS